jgi:glutamyl-tRNA synthetase
MGGKAGEPAPRGTLRSRLAPTPSGYLHVGNAVNFLLTSWWVRARGGTLQLRIDDLDPDRCRPEYVEDIFSSLDWLGIDYDEGPDGPASFYRDFTMADRAEYYREELDNLARRGAGLYGCACTRASRSVLGAAVASGCVGGCWELGLPMATGRTAVRMRLPADSAVLVGSSLVAVKYALGDPVLWRRDGVAGFHLASVVEDRDAGINAIVRGADLLGSSATQILLAPHLAAPRVAAADFRHHELVTGPDGGKLSKSVKSAGLRELVGVRGLRDRVRRLARRLGEPIGIHEPAGA